MSLDKTSHPDRPGPAELIRSGYALRVGEIDALVVSDGTMSIPASVLAVKRRPGRPRGLAGRHVPAAEVRVAAERGRGA
jgi:hypothetical protein